MPPPPRKPSPQRGPSPGRGSQGGGIGYASKSNRGAEIKKREEQKNAWRSGTDIKDKAPPPLKPAASGGAAARPSSAGVSPDQRNAGSAEKSQGHNSTGGPLAALAPAPVTKVQVNWFKSEKSADSTMKAIEEHNFQPLVREALVSKLMSTLGDIISREKQLQDIGGVGGKLSLRFKEEWKENEAALAMIPYEAVDVAHRHNDLYANNFHDPLTLLKSRQFYGRLLQAPLHTRCMVTTQGVHTPLHTCDSCCSCWRGRRACCCGGRRTSTTSRR